MAVESDATDELRELVDEYPGDARSLAEKAKEPMKSRLLRLLDERESGSE